MKSPEDDEDDDEDDDGPNPSSERSSDLLGAGVRFKRVARDDSRAGK